jgi:DNA-binding GntR family transcriptional regulator
LQANVATACELVEPISRVCETSHRLARITGWVCEDGVGAKTERVERSIRELIESDQLGPRGRLPSERQLAEQLEAGRTTIRLVLMKLATEGIVRSEHGRGYFVVGADDQEPVGG